MLPPFLDPVWCIQSVALQCDLTKVTDTSNVLCIVAFLIKQHKKHSVKRHPSGLPLLPRSAEAFVR